MMKDVLHTIARELVAPKKGILAADESVGTAGKRLAAVGVDNTDAHRQAYRELLFTTPGIAQYLSGIILFDETIRQSTADGIPFPTLLREKGIQVGIKVDMGTVPMDASADEVLTTGLDGLAERLEEYRQYGATFAKWRAVFRITASLPSVACIDANARLLAEYADVCQQAGIVPIVEPEVLMTGAHTIDRCDEVTAHVLRTVFFELEKRGVDLGALLLKPNMITPGEEMLDHATPQSVAERTLACLGRTVPAAVPGVVFLSGGQSEELAREHLRLINTMATDAPWALTFSFGRALQERTLAVWQGMQDTIEEAQKTFLHTASSMSRAREGLK